MDRLFTNIKDFAGKMGVSEKTIYRMLGDNQIPFALKMGGQWRFRIEAVDAWLAGQTGVTVETEEVNYNITLRTALTNGSVLYRIHGDNRDEALDELLATVPHTGGLDTSAIKMSILAQESLVSSSLKGVACMRPSRGTSPLVAHSITLLAFLEQPTDFKALDRQKVEIIILTLPANAVEEAILDTRLRRLLMEPDLLAALQKQPPRRELLQLIHESEEKFLPQPLRKPASGKGKKQKLSSSASASK
ncbi:MAG: helix-turn-helix domain-containing protein [Pseudomonadota bacterium]